MFLISSMCATCPVLLILVEFIRLILFVKSAKCTVLGRENLA
jgi:hypothetical protein